MSREQLRQAKQRKRRVKLAECRRYAERVEREYRKRDQYPEVVIDPTNGDAEFVKLVEEAIVGIHFDDPDLFDAGDRQFYRMLKSHGNAQALSWLRETMRALLADGNQFGAVGEIITVLKFGRHLLQRIPEKARRRLMPFNDVFVALGQKLVIKFSSMLFEKGVAGTIFYSRRKPKVEFAGKQWTVAYSRHAIERICERLNPRFINYGASGDIHSFFSRCVYVEPVILHGDQPAFVLYDLCGTPGFARYSTYVKGIFGEANVIQSRGKCYYRVGYCPVVFEGEFAKAKTFLYPGYKCTPEYGRILQSKITRCEKELLINQTIAQNATEVILHGNHEAIKWFHDNGVPQVMQMNQLVYDYSN